MLILPKLIGLGVLLFVPVLTWGLIRKHLYFKLNWGAILWVVLYLLYVIYALFTRHEAIASKYLEYKLSFILFPIIFSFVPKIKPSVVGLMYTFVGSSLLLGILGLIHSYQCYADGGGFVCWITSSFSYIHHPSYASVFFTTAMFLVWYAHYLLKSTFSLLIALVSSAFLVLFIVLCLSLAGVLFLGISISIALFIWIKRKWGLKYVLFLLIAIPLFLVGFIRLVPEIRGEFEEAYLEASTYAKNPKAFIESKSHPLTGSQTRLMMWTATCISIQNYPMGVGTGNVDEVLEHTLNGFGQKELASEHLNPHNQYLQTGLEVGVWGLIVLLIIIGYYSALALKYQNYLLLLLIASLAFNMLFESMLQRQSGIVFYVFALNFLATFLMSSISSKKITP